ADDRDALTVVLLQEHRDLRIVHELLLEPGPDLLLQLGGGAVGGLDLAHQRQVDDPAVRDADAEAGQLLDLEDALLEQITRTAREIGALRRTGRLLEQATIQGRGAGLWWRARAAGSARRRDGASRVAQQPLVGGARGPASRHRDRGDRGQHALDAP